MQSPREEERLLRRALSQRVVEAVLAQADPSSPFSRCIPETLYSTGLRAVLAMNLAHLDCQDGTLLLRRGAANNDHFMPIGAQAVASIQKYLIKVPPGPYWWMRRHLR